MAEGGVGQSPVKFKPVPPPKPTGATLTSPKVILRRPPESPVKTSHESDCQSFEIEVKKNQNASSQPVNEESPSTSPFALHSKPPLLPKPHLATLQSKRIDRSKCDKSLYTTAVTNSVLSVTRKTPSKIFIPEPKSCNVELNDDAKNKILKAPVAKLDEFDYGDSVSPVRPPRSPKPKTVDPLVLKWPSRQQQLNASSQIDVLSKSHSLGRNILPLESKKKSASLGRKPEFSIPEVLENSGSWFKSEERSPVRPPRRRNKSVTQSPEVLSPSEGEAFSFDTIKQNIPVYAQVNYDLKKNRRSKEVTSTNEFVGHEGSGDKSGEMEIGVDNGLDCKLSLQESINDLCGENRENNISKCNESSVGIEECDQELNDDSDYTYFSFSSNIVTSSTFPLDGDKANLVDCSEQQASQTKDCNVPLKQIVNSENVLKLVRNEICNELCADCLPAQILEESLDDSVTSSKVDWQSVRSSFHSSGSESSFGISSIPTAAINYQFSEDNNPRSDASNCNMEKTPEKSCDNTECYGKSDSESLVSGISSVSNAVQLESPVVDRKIYKRLTSSLPTRKTYKRTTRRQSWTGYKDCVHYDEWKNTTWVDEGDSSSGNMGDLDSSDTNIGQQSMVEEVDSKIKSDHSVSRRFNLWLSSFGKSGKKSKSGKRHSQFYFEKQVATKGNTNLKEKIDDNLKHLSTDTKLSNSQYSSPPQQMKCDVNCKVTSDESIAEKFMQSDSEGECGDDGYQESIETIPKDDGKKAFYIANELMTSERVFINALKLLNVNFKEAVLKANSVGNAVISTSEFDRILNSLPQLQKLNEDLLYDLEKRIQNWSSLKKIADVIVKKGPFLKLYATYIQNYEAQCNYLDECCLKYPKFAKVLKEFESSPICQKLTVKHYMLKPVQRIPQYRLLLDDYFRHLDRSSPDYEDTKTALKIVCEVADHANRSIKLGDHLSVLLQLQSQLGNYEIIKPGRVLLKDGELYKLSRKEHQPRYFILLNDCLLYTSYYGSGPSSGLKVNSELSLGGMKVTIPQAEDYHNEFSIISSTRSFTLSARSSQERREWVEAFQKAIQEYTSRQLSFQVQRLNVSRPDGSHESFKLGKEAPIWIQDGRVTKCQLCVAEFTVTFRRHHCRACGKVVCGMCSAFRAPLQYMKFQPDRVCEDCYHTLLREFDSSGTKISEVIKQELNIKKCEANTIENIRSQFKQLGPSSAKKTKKNIPQRLLEVTANDTGSQMCGWLQRRGKRSWKRLWFVLKEQVLYVYKASEDVVALETIPVLGYTVEPMKQIHFQLYEGIDAKLVFQLSHSNQQPLVFSAESENLVNRWIAELQKSTVLK